LGPDGNGEFKPVTVKSIHSKRVPVKSLSAGHSAGFALKKIKRSAIRKGMVLTDTKLTPQASWLFEADVAVLFHSTTINVNYQPVVQCMTMRQSAKIVQIVEKEVLRTGDRAKVLFKFMFRPEYLKVGMRMIFREGRCKGIGVISKICLPEPEKELKDATKAEKKDDKPKEAKPKEAKPKEAKPKEVGKGIEKKDEKTKEPQKGMEKKDDKTKEPKSGASTKKTTPK